MWRKMELMLGKLFLPQLLEAKSSFKVSLSVIPNDTIIPANSSIFQAIEIASDFVGEAMAVVDQKKWPNFGNCY